MTTITHTVFCQCDYLEFKVVTVCRKDNSLSGHMVFHSERCKSKTPFVKRVDHVSDTDKMIDGEMLSILKDFSDDKRISVSTDDENVKVFYITARKELSSDDNKEIAIVALDTQRTIVDFLKS